MGLRRKLLRTGFITIAMAVDVAAFVIWGARPPRIYSDWLGLPGPASDNPLRIVRAWMDGAAPWTPAGFLSLLSPAELILPIAFFVILAVLIILLGMTWSRSGVLGRTEVPVEFSPSRLLRFRVRGVLLGIGILGIFLGWEVVTWETWNLQQRIRAKIKGYSQAESDCRHQAENARKQLLRLQAPPTEMGTEEARAAVLAWSRDYERRQIAFLERKREHVSRLKRKYERALAHPRLPIEADPPSLDPEPEFFEWVSRGQYSRASQAYEETLRRYPAFADVHAQRAWLLASCPDARFRDGRAAIAAATRACELTNWGDDGALRALAAAYAEAGDFDAAVRWQEKALEQQSRRLDMTPSKEEDVHLALYRARKPYRSRRP